MMEEDQEIGNKLISITLHSIEDKCITDNKLTQYFPQKSWILIWSHNKSLGMMEGDQETRNNITWMK